MVILEGVLIICALALIYLFYQLARNQKVYSIRLDWIYKGDGRHIKYTYGYMFDPSKHNYYGLKFPKAEHFK